MTLIFALLAAALALSLLLAQRLRLSLTWGPDGRSIRLRYLMIRLGSDRRPASKTEAAARREAAARKKEKKARKKRRDPSGRRRWRASWPRLIALLPEATAAVWKSVGFLVRRCRIEHLRIEGPIGTSDPALTGMLWGAVAPVQEAVLALGLGQARLWPEFVDGRTELTFDATLSVAAGSLVATPLVLVWHLPKRRLWRAVRRVGVPEAGEGPRQRPIHEEGEGSHDHTGPAQAAR